MKPEFHVRVIKSTTNDVALRKNQKLDGQQTIVIFKDKQWTLENILLHEMKDRQYYIPSQW